jgi:hypothetical protein
MRGVEVAMRSSCQQRIRSFYARMQDDVVWGVMGFYLHVSAQPEFKNAPAKLLNA